MDEYSRIKLKYWFTLVEERRKEILFTGEDVGIFDYSTSTKAERN